jgi:hypothetical protein
MATSSQNTPRIFIRGDNAQFKVGFFADDQMTTPLVPIDPTFPQYTIFDPQGTVIQTSTGTATTPGNYILNFLVPKDAPLSYFGQAPQRFNNEGQGEPLTANDARYRIEWTMLTAENYQVQFTEEFDVQDVAVTQSLSRELKYLVMAHDSFDLFWRGTVSPYRVDMKVLVRGSENDKDCAIASGYYDSTQPSGNQGDICIIRDGDSYVYQFRVEEKKTHQNTCYVVLWKIQEHQFAPARTEFQIITAIGTGLLPLFTSLRMLIDKFQKRVGRLQAYEDSDLLEYISQGVRQTNLSYPTTSWSMDQMPDDMQHFVLLAAGWYGLKAQSLLETDLDFQFSGQSVTLSVNRSAGLDAVAANMMEEFNKKIGPAKMAYVRRARGVGTFAGKNYSYRNMYNYTFKISSFGSTSNFLNLLTKIGLL